jgi:signal transduction histidine kinase
MKLLSGLPFRLREPFVSRWASSPTYVVVWLAVLLCIANGALVWFGYAATSESIRALEVLRERRQTEGMALTAASIDRDMKGAATVLLGSLTSTIIEPDPPYELVRNAAATFAIFPYAESLVVWKRLGDGTNRTHALNRTDRPPGWAASTRTDDLFPVSVLKNPPELQNLTEAISHQYEPLRPIWVLHQTLAGDPYQIIVRYLQNPNPPFELWGFVALSVNLRWVREEYFGPVLQQASTIGGSADVLSLYITDERNRTVVATGPRPADAHQQTREFPLLFVDQTLIRGARKQLRTISTWRVHGLSARKDTLASAAKGPRSQFILIVLSAGLSLGGLLLVLRAVASRVALASMKADFVSAVTHELKTPLAIIRLVGDTLSSGHYDSERAVQEYARVLSREAIHLGELIDQLLTYAKYSEAQQIDQSHFAVVSPDELIESVVDQSEAVLKAANAEVYVDVPHSLPPVRVDVAAMRHAIRNLIDNAVKYSAGPPKLRITGRPDDRVVSLTFSDQGIGIRRDDLPHVFDRFYRGSNATKGGSGLGLSIVKRIIEYHRGQVRIVSTPNVGTEIVLQIPTA